MSIATIEIEGNIGQAPELRHTQNGKPVLSFSVAHTPRRKNHDTGQYEDAGDTLWMNVSVWEGEAEHLARVLEKGTLVVVKGEPVLRKWEKGDRSGVNLEIKYPRVSVSHRPPRTPQAPGLNGNAGTDPWATAATNATQNAAQEWTAPEDTGAPF